MIGCRTSMSCPAMCALVQDMKPGGWTCMYELQATAGLAVAVPALSISHTRRQRFDCPAVGPRHNTPRAVLHTHGLAGPACSRGGTPLVKPVREQLPLYRGGCGGPGFWCGCYRGGRTDAARAWRLLQGAIRALQCDASQQGHGNPSNRWCRPGHQPKVILW